MDENLKLADDAEMKTLNTRMEKFVGSEKYKNKVRCYVCVNIVILILLLWFGGSAESSDD